MKVDGKVAAVGKYKLSRILTNIMTSLVYELHVSDEHLLFYEKDKDITEEIRHAQFQDKNIVFLWRKPCKIGLPFSLEKI